MKLRRGATASPTSPEQRQAKKKGLKPFRAPSLVLLAQTALIFVESTIRCETSIIKIKGLGKIFFGDAKDCL